MLYYVGFSIHGTNKFISVNKQDAGVVDSNGTITIDGINFKQGHSRTSSLHGGVKLLHPGLNDQWGHPTKDRSVVIAVFQDLVNKGWKIHTNQGYPEVSELTSKPTGTYSSGKPNSSTAGFSQCFINYAKDQVAKHGVFTVDRNTLPELLNALNQASGTTYHGITYQRYQQSATSKRLMSDARLKVTETDTGLTFSPAEDWQAIPLPPTETAPATAVGIANALEAVLDEALPPRQGATQDNDEGEEEEI